jgi:uncharacterized membrane protein
MIYLKTNKTKMFSRTVWVAIIYLLVLFAMSVVYSFVDMTHIQKPGEVEMLSWVDAFYVSTSTQTFLGMGDYIPAGTAGRIIISLHAVGSVLLIGDFIAQYRLDSPHKTTSK